MNWISSCLLASIIQEYEWSELLNLLKNVFLHSRKQVDRVKGRLCMLPWKVSEFKLHCKHYTRHGNVLEFLDAKKREYFEDYWSLFKTIGVLCKQFGSRWGPTKYGASSEIQIVDWHSDLISRESLDVNIEFLQLLKERSSKQFTWPANISFDICVLQGNSQYTPTWAIYVRMK